MTILDLSFATVKDAALFAEYVQNPAELMRDHEVEGVARGRYVDSLAGLEAPGSVGAVFRYPTVEAARAFFTSDAYLALVPLRDKACDITILLFDEATGALHLHST